MNGKYINVEKLIRGTFAVVAFNSKGRVHHVRTGQSIYEALVYYFEWIAKGKQTIIIDNSIVGVVFDHISEVPKECYLDIKTIT